MLRMTALALLQLATPPAGPRRVEPVLAFPEPALDDSAAYEGYRTRFYRDARGNAVQVYLDGRSGRVVQVWADAANESIGFTARDGAGRPAALAWGGPDAVVAEAGRMRTVEYRIATGATTVVVGWAVLGSMRVERDFQYARGHLAPYTAAPFRQRELTDLVAALERLPPTERGRHLALLHAPNLTTLRARRASAFVLRRVGGRDVARLVQPTLDGESRLVLELGADPAEATVQATGRTVTIRSRTGRPVVLAVRTATDAAPLTPLARDEIFTPEFLGFLAAARDSARAAPGTAADLRARRLEREVRGVELLSSAEKLMAGMPNYATYFGRDMMMTALMMRPVWRPEMSERVVASVLRKLSPTGHVSHEEALAGQAIRESAGEYAALVAEHLRLAASGSRAAADSALARARDVLRDLRTTRENYHMMDGEFQLPVLVAGYLADSTVPADRKRAFLLGRDGAAGAPTRLALLLRELRYVAALTAPYVAAPDALHLVAFPPRDSTRWASASWRDSGAGYANGRFAMDINAIWAPAALDATARILAAVRALGLEEQARGAVAALDAEDPTGAAGAADARDAGALAAYVRDSAALRRAVDAWRGARRHFVVSLAPREIEARVGARLRALPDAERRYWEGVLAATGAARDPLEFLALALDAAGQPIGVVNTDPAMRLFLGDAPPSSGALPADDVRRTIDAFVRPYPVGLFVNGLGPLVANDAYADPAVWEAFRQDTYHSPLVVWGREVNLALLALAHQRALAADPSLVAAIDAAIARITDAVEASGFRHSELWSYRIENGRLLPTRYGISSDLQLWSSADLAVQYTLWRLQGR